MIPASNPKMNQKFLVRRTYRDYFEKISGVKKITFSVSLYTIYWNFVHKAYAC